MLTILPALGVASRLTEARTAMEDARSALLSGDTEAAAEAFGAAKAAFGSARESMRNPLLRFAGLIPVLGNTPDATAAIVEAGSGTAEAGDLLASALDQLPGGLTSLAPVNGRIPLEPLEEMAEPLEQAGVLLDEALVAMEEAPRTWLLGPVADARGQFESLLEQAAGAVRVSAILARDLPPFLGADGTRRYFFGAQNPAELRGTGGIIGAYTIMTVRNGKLSLDSFRSTQFLQNLSGSLEQVPAPNPDYVEIYDEFRSRGFWPNINMTPDFPSAATAIENLYEQRTGDQVDGTVVVDPFALEALMRVGSAVEVPATGQEIDADNVAAYVMNEAYGEVRESERKLVLGEAAKQVLEQFLGGSVSGAGKPAEAEQPVGSEGSGTKTKGGTKGSTKGGTKGGAPPSPSAPGEEDPGRGGKPGDGEDAGLGDPFQLAAAARAVVETAAQGHLLMHSTDPEIQDGLVRAGVAGSLPAPEGDFLAVVANNGSANKTDFYVDRSVEYTVGLMDGGAAQAHAVVGLHNDAPTSGEPVFVIGPEQERFEAGQNVTILSTYCATSCHLLSFLQGGEPGGVTGLDLRELGHPVYTSLVDLPSEASETLEYDWSLEDVWQDDGSGGSYRLTLHGQPTARPTDVRIEVVAPPGTRIVDTSPDMEVDGDRATWEGRPQGEMTFEVDFGRSLLSRIVHFFTQPVFELG